MRRASILLALVLSSVAIGCKEDKGGQAPQGQPPPPSGGGGAAPPSGGSAVAAKDMCDAASVGISDPKIAAILPPTIGDYCIRKTDQVQSFGEGTPKKIEDVSDVIDGQGEIYAHNYYAKRYDRVRYVHRAGKGEEVEVNVSTYDKPENAYGLFTYQVVANKDVDPEASKADNRTPPKAIKGGGAAALGKGNAYLWRGNYLVELTYSNTDPNASEAEQLKTASVVLQKMVETIGEKIVGATDPPADVRLLPTEAEGRVPLGIDYVPAKFKKPEGKGDALFLNIGSYATAMMRDGKKRFRVIAVAREEKDAARDAIAAFSKLPGSLPIKEAKEFSDEAWHFSFNVGQGGAGAGGKAEGVAARRGSNVMAVIDEELALGDPAKKDDWPRLTKEEKIGKLKTLLAKGSAPAPAPSASASK